MSLKGLLFSMLHMIGFDGVLGGVMGTVCSVVFGVLSTFVNFTWDAILGITTCGSNSYFCFFFQDSNALLKPHLVLHQKTFFLE